MDKKNSGMKRKKREIVYSDDRVIKQQDEKNTTVVTGVSIPNDNLLLSLDSAFEKAKDVFRSSCYRQKNTRGVARLSPEDTYDEKKGVTIASRKAMLKGDLYWKRKYTRMMFALDKARDITKKALASIENDICNDLESLDSVTKDK